MGSQIFLTVLCLAMVVFHTSYAETPAIFILGDSTADVGTNSLIPTSTIRADFPPNGIDFPKSRPTGRFSNGFNSADFIDILKHKSFRGINFASGGSGILQITGQNNASSRNGETNVISLGDQIKQLASVKRNMMSFIGVANTKAFLSNCLFFISTGSNDFFGYKLSGSTIPRREFISALGRIYEQHLRNLYRLGARKFGIISVPPIGCCPSQRIHTAGGSCSEDLNQLAKAFHLRIHAILTKFSSQYPDMKFSHGNAFKMTANIIENPRPFGFKDVKTACCGKGKLNAESFCIPGSSVCHNRHDHLFWDLFHPTEAASKLAAFTLFNGGPEFMTPLNFKQLAQA
ncbi:hypothetical protein K2173_012546 [Erythroxylum novogranatense]|uniref:Uncharacterized protein n=1 Tax=Erythroxylum novogranatense TaxID=1862640 RepID=A0AAV8TJJ2_9ROSI|nr:hypothetical protein K2173_012546 [Erythroxylum novogranatense]